MRRLPSLVVVSVAAVLVGCGGGGATPLASGPVTVAATEKEFSISLASSTIAPGDLSFAITNAGTIPHEFVVVKTDKPADQLPQASGEVDEEQLQAVDEVEDIQPGAAPKLNVHLDAGHYVVLCNVPGHYSSGMRADLTVQ